ncbi:MAG: oligopeptide transporter, OPT family, partial [Candidatus Nephrothrix sp. EaCA]
MAGGILGIMFVALLRRMMVDDKELPFPESVAAAEIHKAGQSSGSASKYLFGAMIGGALIKILGDLKLFAAQWEKFIPFGKETITGTPLTGQGGLMLSSPAISPAYFGVGYIIGPKLGALNFSGGVLAWGLLAPIIYYFLAPAVDGNVWASYLMGKDASLTMENA